MRRWLIAIALVLITAAVISEPLWRMHLPWFKEDKAPRAPESLRVVKAPKPELPAKTTENAVSLLKNQGLQIHVVKKGEWLVKIAKKYDTDWCRIWLNNQKTIGDDPNLIYPGQRLEIQGKDYVIISDEEPKAKCGRIFRRVKSMAQIGPFYWDKPSGDPFGSRDFTKGIMMFSAPEHVRTEWINKAQGGEKEWHQIKKGDRFSEMLFGNFKVRRDVIARWAKSDAELLAARKYTAIYEGRVYFLVSPLICNNWAWWDEALPPAPPEEARPPEIPPSPGIISPPEAKPSMLKKKKMLALLLPPSVLALESGIPHELRIPPALEKKPCLICQPDWEAWAYTGYHWGAQRQNRKDWDWYYGGNISLFPCEIQLENGIFRAGPSAQYVRWLGEVQETIRYRGEMMLYGAELQHLTDDIKNQLKIYFGTKHGEVFGKGFNYQSYEKNGLMVFDLGHMWFSPGRYFFQYEFGIRLELADQGEKNSFLNGAPIKEGPLDQYLYLLRAKVKIAKLYIGDADIVPTFEDTLGYGRDWFSEPRVGLEFMDNTFGIYGSYYWHSGAFDDMVGAHLIVDISKLGDYVWHKWIKPNPYKQYKGMPLDEKNYKSNPNAPKISPTLPTPQSPSAPLTEIERRFTLEYPTKVVLFLAEGAPFE